MKGIEEHDRSSIIHIHSKTARRKEPMEIQHKRQEENNPKIYITLERLEFHIKGNKETINGNFTIRS